MRPSAMPCSDGSAWTTTMTAAAAAATPEQGGGHRGSGRSWPGVSDGRLCRRGSRWVNAQQRRHLSARRRNVHTYARTLVEVRRAAQAGPRCSRTRYADRAFYKLPSPPSRGGWLGGLVTTGWGGRHDVAMPFGKGGGKRRVRHISHGSFLRPFPPPPPQISRSLRLSPSSMKRKSPALARAHSATRGGSAVGVFLRLVLSPLEPACYSRA